MPFLPRLKMQAHSYFYQSWFHTACYLLLVFLNASSISKKHIIRHRVSPCLTPVTDVEAFRIYRFNFNFIFVEKLGHTFKLILLIILSIFHTFSSFLMVYS